MWPITQNVEPFYTQNGREEEALERKPLAGNALMRGTSESRPIIERPYNEAPISAGQGFYKIAEVRLLPKRNVGKGGPFDNDTRPQIEPSLGTKL